jgi:hypothetical protein
MDTLRLANQITKALFPDLYANSANTLAQTCQVIGARGIIEEVLKIELAALPELLEAPPRIPAWIIDELRRLDRIAGAIGGTPEIAAAYNEAAIGLIGKMRLALHRGDGEINVPVSAEAALVLTASNAGGQELALAVEKALGWRDGKRDAELDALLTMAMNFLATPAAAEAAPQAVDLEQLRGLVEEWRSRSNRCDVSVGFIGGQRSAYEACFLMLSALIDTHKRNVKPWEDTFPPTLLPKWVREQQAVDLGPRSMDTAPRDGTMLRLLVQFEDHATEDTDAPAWTIGANSFDDTGEDLWQFAGWCWTYDHFTEGKGTPVGWLPLIDSQQKESSNG